MLDVENKVFQKTYMDIFEALPDNIINTFIEYLQRLKVEFMRLSIKRTQEVEDTIYRNGLMTATTKFLEMFAQVKAGRDINKHETDKITGDNIQDKKLKEIQKKQEWKNI